MRVDFRWGVWTSWVAELPVERALEELYSGGFRYLELSVEHFNEILARSGELGYLDETESFKSRALALAGLGAVDVNSLPPVELIHAHGPFKPFNLQSFDEAEKSIETVKEWIRWCSKLGVKVLVCHPFTVKGAEWRSLENLNVSSFRRLGKAAEEHGVVLAVENMGRGYASLASHLLRIVEEAPSTAVCVDTGHANLEAYRGSVERLITELGSTIAATHLSDNDGSGDQHVFPGKGTIDWRRVLEAFKEVRYGKPLNLEIPGESKAFPDPAQRVKYLVESINALTRSILA